MPEQEVHQPAPDFSIADLNGEITKLSDYRGQAHVLLVLNRGFF